MLLNKDGGDNMKKILSAVLIAAMIITAMPMAYAQSVSSLLTSIQSPIPMVKTVKPDADLLVKKTADSTFVDGPLSIVESTLTTTFDFKAILDMAKVRQAFTNWMTIARGYAVGDADLQTRIDNLKVEGVFYVDITYPNTLSVPATFTGGANMYGFNAGASTIFKETGRTITPVDANTSMLTISIAVKDTTDTNNYVLASDMETYLTTYLADMDLTCVGAAPTVHGNYTVTGVVRGQNKIYDGAEHVGTIDYRAVQTGTSTQSVAETISVTNINPGATNVSGGGTGSNKVTVEFVSAGETHHSITKVNSVKVNVDEIEKPKREGFAFAGWYDDEQNTIPVTGEIDVKEHSTIHAKWINTTVPSALNDDRAAYVIGYPEGDVRPTANISREEIATIFYRLLKKEVREELYMEENSFADVDTDRWSNKEISTMANGKYIQGYEDGTFRPEDDITRGEFVTIAARFLDAIIDESYKTFNDIDGHWAEAAIHSVADQEWIGGYEDGSFRPDELITRAEAMAIINRMLVYHIDHDSLIDDVKHWPDNHPSEWYYLEVLKATNTREHSVRENGYTEDWHEILPNPDWSVIK